MNATKLRSWWWRRSGLDGSLAGRPPADVLDRAGWARSVGGVGPYLTLFARAGTSRADADAAVAALEIHELPSARGCTYVLPARDYALGLTVGRSFGDAEARTAAKLGVTDDEIERLCAAVVGALSNSGPLDPDGIRAATGSASRSLGEEGKKKGLTTTLPLALGRLQSRGDIRRVPVNGRLDQQRYAYVAWTPSPLAEVPDGDPFVALARRFFAWHGPATVGEFQWFSGLGVKAAKAAVAPLGLVPAEEASDRFLLPDDVAAWEAFDVRSDEPAYALVSSLDPITANRRDVRALVDAADEAVLSKAAGDLAANALMDLPSHAILDRGRLVGLWEYSPDDGTIVWATFGARHDAALEAAVDRTSAFVRDQLGDAQSFSLDSPKSRAPRLEALRRLR
jgi:hypothetical protein